MSRLKKADSEAMRNRAFELYMNTGSGYADIADAVGVGKDTVSDWATRYNWKQTKAANSITREKNISMMLVQINNLLETIAKRPKESQYPTSAESDSITKMTNNITKLSGRTSLPDYFNVQTEFIKYLHSVKPDLAKQVVDHSKEFLQSKTNELN